MNIKIWAQEDTHKLDLTVPDGTIDHWEMFDELNSSKYNGVRIVHSSKNIFVQLRDYSDFQKAMAWLSCKITGV